MPIFQYKCEGCSAVFEHLVGDKEARDVSCVACGSRNFTRLVFSSFAVRPEDRDCENCTTGGCSGCEKEKVPSDNFSKNFVS